MKVTWILQKAAFADADVVQRMSYAIEEIGDVPHWLGYAMGTIAGGDLDKMVYEEPVIALGSIAFIKFAQREMQANPLAWADWTAMRCASYYSRYTSILVQRKWAMLSWGTLLQRKEFIYDTFGKDGIVFIRPDENTKRFTGQRVADNELERFHAYYNDECDPQDIIVVSTPEIINREWRLVVHDRNVVAASQYKEEGGFVMEAGCPLEVKQLAEEASTNYVPHPLFVFDVAETVDGPRLLEIGSFNCAGLYKCDVHAVARAAHIAAEKDWLDVNTI